MNNSSTRTFEFKSKSPMGILRIIGLVIIGVIAAGLLALLFGLLVKALWNWLMPTIFKLPEITYWQAFGLVLLCKILFSSFGHGHKENHVFGKWIRSKSDRRKFEKYWNQEGKAAFDSWIVKIEAETSRKSNEPQKSTRRKSQQEKEN